MTLWEWEEEGEVIQQEGESELSQQEAPPPDQAFL